MKKILFSVLSLVLAGAAWADPTASIFVKDAEEFKNIQKELDQLKSGLGQDNAELDSLWKRAGRIAKMNDKCSMISINEVLDDECSHFYAVELPEFETKYMEVTGELRLGSMTMGNSLAERTEQIKACAAALGGILVSKDQLLKLNGTIDLEPLSFDGAFDASYDFNLFFDSNRMEQQKRMMDRWLGKCGDIVLRKSGDEYAPLFLQSLALINDSLNRVNANVKIMVNPKHLDFYLDLNKNISGSYYLNGVELFNVSSLPTGRKYSHLVVDVAGRKVNLPLGLDGKMQHFKGRVEFTSVYQEKDLVGRWSWTTGNSKKVAGAAAAKAKGTITSTAVEGDPTEFKAVEGDVTLVADSSAMAAAVAELAAETADFDQSAAAKAATKPTPVAVPKTADANLASATGADASAKDAAKAATEDKSGVSSRIHWVPLAICGAVAIGGGVMAAVFNNKAKTERDKNPMNNGDYNDHKDKIESAQTKRNIGIGLAIAGAVGAGVTFLF